MPPRPRHCLATPPGRPRPAMARLRQALAASALLPALAWPAMAQAQEPVAPSPAGEANGALPFSLRSPDDGHLDLSEFVDQSYGFMPVAIPVTEPAIGIGLAGALAFIDKPDTGDGTGRPDISLVGGLATDNGTRGVLAGDMRYWRDGRLQTIAGALDATLQLDYYGTGSDAFLNDRPLSYALDLTAAMAKASYQIGRSRTWLGLGYLLLDTGAGFRQQPASVSPRDSEARLGGLTASLSYDTRDNLFTPRGGHYVSLSNVVYDEALGSDRDFNRLSLIGMQHFEVAPDWYWAWREMVVHNAGDAPFYAKPFIFMRGVPAMRYLGDDIAQVETEVSWQFTPRYTVLAFAGTGAAEEEFQRFSSTSQVVAGGAGMRYLLARRYGFHVGLDLAWSEDEPALYVQFGSAWLRP